MKVIHVKQQTKNIGSFETEKEDIIQRRNYLKDKLLVSPKQVIESMPSAIGEQFQGEWALYSCSMFASALVNISHLYPKTREESITILDSLIKIVMSPELRQYDKERWNEDPLEGLDGGESHISYYSHLAWMIGKYKSLGGGKNYDSIYHCLCKAMNDRILSSPTMNVPTYPEEVIYVPDMLVAIVALEGYSHKNKGKYHSTVKKWLEVMKKKYIDKETGLLMSFIGDDDKDYPIKGSYSALNCYYLTFLDDAFAREQYEKLKTNFIQYSPLSGLKEYHNHSCFLGLDIDAGPILMNLSPSGTAFALGPITYFGDSEIRKSFLKTAEIAGFTWRYKGKSHYLLANIALVGEAITLAMRTHIVMK